ncbi:hypothetical protein BDV18DRAFT_162957 [Aspergillus unguis]
MGMNWTPEANVKLLLGILEQLKKENFKLSYQALAEQMGPDCSRQAIAHQICMLRKKSAARESGERPATGDADTPLTPAATPKKRRAAQAKNCTPSKKAKGAKQGKDDVEEMEIIDITEDDDEVKVEGGCKTDIKDCESDDVFLTNVKEELDA